MYFTVIVDSTYTNQKTLDIIKQKIINIGLPNIKIDVYIIHDTKPMDLDTDLAIRILMNEINRTPVICDAKVAKFYPEIVKNQTTIVMLNHETNLSIDINEYNLFNENAVIHNGARFDYIDKEYHDLENEKMLNVIDIDNHVATCEYYTYLAKMFYYEHNFHPLLLIPRCRQKLAKSESDIISIFNDRHKLIQYIGMSSDCDGINFNSCGESIYKTCISMAVNTLTDERLSIANNNNFEFKKI